MGVVGREVTGDIGIERMSPRRRILKWIFMDFRWISGVLFDLFHAVFTIVWEENLGKTGFSEVEKVERLEGGAWQEGGVERSVGGSQEHHG